MESDTEGEQHVYDDTSLHEFDPFFDIPTSSINNTNKNNDNGKDDDLIVDEDVVIEEYIVDMSNFNHGEDYEAVQNSKKQELVLKSNELVELDIVDNEDFESGDEFDDTIEGTRKRKLREIQKQEKAKGVSQTAFYVGQTFASAYEVKEYIKLHSIETRRKIVFIKNDLTRVRAGCEGLVADFVDGNLVERRTGLLLSKQEVGVGHSGQALNIKQVVGHSGQAFNKQQVVSGQAFNKQQVVGQLFKGKGKEKESYSHKVQGGKKEKKKKRKLIIECPWVLHVSKELNKETWRVKTFEGKHECLETRENKHCTYNFLSTKLVDQLSANPKIPTKAVKAQLESSLGLEVPRTKSHFSGRAKCDVLLNNMCEVLNRWLLEARDKPIITALEYVREYLMKRIVNVIHHIGKSSGPLTPSATKQFESTKNDANKCTVLWSGSNLYQVNGPHGGQCVVDIDARNCSCRKWEITGMPCKHAVAVFWNMAAFSKDLGPVERWFDPIYHLDTWKRAYTCTINPTTERMMWPKSNVPTTLLPPKYKPTTGRPKKNRIKGFHEDESINNDGKLSRKGKSTTCGKCGIYGHNKRGCTNESQMQSTESQGIIGSQMQSRG